MYIAVSGKGGVGKTTIAALMLDEYARHGVDQRILAVDADPAMTLHLALGFQRPVATLADLRDTVVFNRKTLGELPTRQSRAGYITKELRERKILTTRSLRGISMDYLAMGRGERRGCYCGINNILAEVLANYVNSYDIVVIDAPAGMEHINRYVMPELDLFLVVATPNMAALEVAEQIFETAARLGMKTKCAGLVLNRVGLNDHLDLSYQKNGIPRLLTCLLSSPSLGDLDLMGLPAVKLSEDSPIRQTIWDMTQKELCASAGVTG